MYDLDKCSRCMNISKSWFGRKFGDITQRVLEKLGFKKEYDDATANQATLDQGGELPWEFDSGFKTIKRNGWRTEVVFWFLSCIEFYKEFKVEPKKLGLKLSKGPDEYGTEVKGVF